MTSLKPAALSKFLSKADVNASFVQKLKIAYRPFICPFGDLLAKVNKDDKVFDIGAGAGQFLLLVANYTEAKSLYGIEISESLVNNANQLFESNNIKKEYCFKQYNGTDFPAELSVSDTVFLIDVWHHVPESHQVKFIELVFKSMKPKSKLILKDMNAASLWVYFNKLHDLILSQEIGNEYTLNDAEACCKKAGFEIKNVETKRMWWYDHYTLTLVKP